jgi:hypothetical protein
MGKGGIYVFVKGKDKGLGIKFENFLFHRLFSPKYTLNIISKTNNLILCPSSLTFALQIYFLTNQGNHNEQL